MKSRLLYIISIFIATFFTACNTQKISDTEVSTFQKVQISHTLISDKSTDTPIIDTWLGLCHYAEDTDESYQAQLLLNIDLSFIYTEKIYPTNDCTGDYHTEQNTEIGTYKLGARTKGEDGKPAFNFERHTLVDNKINDEYFMVRLTSSELIFTDQKEDYSQPNGESIQTRNNYFKEEPRIIFSRKINH